MVEEGDHGHAGQVLTMPVKLREKLHGVADGQRIRAIPARSSGRRSHKFNCKRYAGGIVGGSIGPVDSTNDVSWRMRFAQQARKRSQL